MALKKEKQIQPFEKILELGSFFKYGELANRLAARKEEKRQKKAQEALEKQLAIQLAIERKQEEARLKEIERLENERRKAEEERKKAEAKRIEQLEKQKKREEAMMKAALQSQVDQLLEGELYDTVLKMMDSGYILTSEQVYTMSNIIESHIHNQCEKPEEKLQKVEYWVSKGWRFTEQQIINLLLEPEFHLVLASPILKDITIDTMSQKNIEEKSIEQNIENISKKIPFLHEHILSFATKPHFSASYYQNWLQRLESVDHLAGQEEINNLIAVLKNNHDYLFQNINSIDQFIKTSSIYSKFLNATTHNLITSKSFDAVQQEVQYINDLFVQYFPDGINKLIQNTLKAFTPERIEKKIIAKQKSVADHTHINDIPEESKMILHSIEDYYRYVLENKDGLNKKELTEINILVEQRLPEILHKYLSLHPDYRDFVNREQKTPKDILYNSIHNILDVLKELTQELNIEKMNGLHAMERYTTNFKK